ncbi:hypothetical protein A2U01_0086773, partial [Trifolium medium]|nr:hypothetical protein [Trifolium medium]
MNNMGVSYVPTEVKLEKEVVVEETKKVDPDRNRFEGQNLCNDVAGKEEVIALTEFVTTEKLEKNEEKPKDKE